MRYLPEGQIEQSASSSWLDDDVPVSPRYLPEGQMEQSACSAAAVPASALYLPAGQTVHVPVPAEEANLPAAHVKHCVADVCAAVDTALSVKYVPLLQDVQSSTELW